MFRSRIVGVRPFHHLCCCQCFQRATDGGRDTPLCVRRGSPDGSLHQIQAEDSVGLDRQRAVLGCIGCAREAHAVLHPEGHEAREEAGSALRHAGLHGVQQQQQRLVGILLHRRVRRGPPECVRQDLRIHRAGVVGHAVEELLQRLGDRRGAACRFSRTVANCELR